MPTELEKEDICLIIDRYRRRPEERLKGAFDRLGADFNFAKYLTLKERPYWEDKWGRMGINLMIDEDKWRGIAFGIYYDTTDHKIPLLEDVPELALFVDIDPSLRDVLKNAPDFVGALHKLQALGWEENLITQRTTNEWRLLYWRRPLTNLEALNSVILGEILEAKLTEVTAQPAFLSTYVSAR